MWHQFPSISRLWESAQVTRLADISLALSAWIVLVEEQIACLFVHNTGSCSSAHSISPTAIDLSPHMTINIFIIYIVCVNEGCI